MRQRAANAILLNALGVILIFLNGLAGYATLRPRVCGVPARQHSPAARCRWSAVRRPILVGTVSRIFVAWHDRSATPARGMDRSVRGVPGLQRRVVLHVAAVVLRLHLRRADLTARPRLAFLISSWCKAFRLARPADLKVRTTRKRNDLIFRCGATVWVNNTGTFWRLHMRARREFLRQVVPAGVLSIVGARMNGDWLELASSRPAAASPIAARPTFLRRTRASGARSSRRSRSIARSST